MITLHIKLSAVLSALSIALERWASWHRTRAFPSRQLGLKFMTTGKRSRVLRLPR